MVLRCFATPVVVELSCAIAEEITLLYKYMKELVNMSVAQTQRQSLHDK